MKTILSALRMAVLTGALAACATASAIQAEARGRDKDGGGTWTQAQYYTQADEDRNGRGRGRGRGGDDARPYVPLESIIGQIQARTPGRLVGVRGPNGQGIYRIIWETPDGRVITFVVDGRTGQILR
jgi:uncharacterized membrane protein YkoI